MEVQMMCGSHRLPAASQESRRKRSQMLASGGKGESWELRGGCRYQETVNCENEKGSSGRTWDNQKFRITVLKTRSYSIAYTSIKFAILLAQPPGYSITDIIDGQCNV